MSNDLKARGVRVKALEWREEWGYAARAETSFGVYAIQFDGDCHASPFRLFDVFDGRTLHPALEAAKAAAQADYESRILAALETSDE